METHNLGIVETRKVADFGWLVSGLRDIVIGVSSSEIRELCHVGWQTCWIPLNLINHKSHPNFGLSLEDEKGKFYRLPSKRKTQLKRYMHLRILKFLISFQESPWKLFHVHRVLEYAIITLEGDNVEIVKAQFCDSYEHCSALLCSVELWFEVNDRRVEAADKLLQLTSDNEERKMITDYRDQASSHRNILMERMKKMKKK